ncbi:MAG: hypothetical protein MJZ38_05810 [archaeon]|nr:hypothetical protein [archaeon]
MNLQRDRVVLITCLVFALIQLYFTSQCFGNGRQQYEFNTGLFCGLFCMVPWFFYRFGIMKLPLWMVFFIDLAIFFHGYGVLMLNYDLLLHYDNLTHSFSSFVISLCVILTLLTMQRYNSSNRFTPGLLSLFVFLIMAKFGVIWEVFQHLVNVIAGVGLQSTPWDTIRDLICNSVGSLAGALFVLVISHRVPMGELIDSVQLHPKLRGFLGSKK